VRGLDAEQRQLLASLAARAQKEELGWATAVARVSVALQELGVPASVAFEASLRVHGTLELRWVR
jgi:hypothetical protein